jgi:hypothetical protein
MRAHRRALDHRGIVVIERPLCANAGTICHLFDDPVSDAPIDWSTELPKIVREFDGLPPEPPRPQRRSQPQRRPSRTEFRMERIQEIATKYEFYDRLAIVGVWVRVALVATLAVSLFWWPYSYCGFPLVAFLISNLMAVIGGVSLTVRTWRDRLVWPFAGSMLVVVLAWTVIAMHTLPRFGYSPAGGAAAGWTCSSTR